MTIEELMKLRNETVEKIAGKKEFVWINPCLLYTSPSPRDRG